MKCTRCGEEFNYPGSNICGNCADDLRDEELANVLLDDIARQQDDRGTYELDGGYR